MFTFIKIIIIAYVSSPPVKYVNPKSAFLSSPTVTLEPLQPPPPPPPPLHKWPSWLPPINNHEEDYDGDSS